MDYMEKEIPVMDAAMWEAGLKTSCNEIVKELERHYPGHPWIVFPLPEPNGDMSDHICIQHAMCSANYGVVLEYHGWKNKKWVHAAGEILERHGLPRGPFNEDIAQTAPRNLRGNIIGDNS